MSEYTKGKLIAEPKISDLEKLNPRFSIGIEGGKILFHSTLENALANTHKLLRCWNSHNDLLAACQKSLIFCKGLVGKHPVAKILKKELEAAIAKAKP